MRRGVLNRSLPFVRRTLSFAKRVVTRAVAVDVFFMTVFRLALGADISLNEFEQASSPQCFSDDL